MARAHVLANIRANLLNLAVQIPERIQTFESEAQQPRADVERYESERPIKVVYRLRQPMPAEMFETNRRGG